MAPGHRRFPKLPQGGHVGAVFGLVVAFHKQLGETKGFKALRIRVYCVTGISYSRDVKLILHSFSPE